MLVLRKLSQSDGGPFAKACRATARTDPTFARGFVEGMSFVDYLSHLQEAEQGLNLPENHVPSTMYWGFVGTAIVGRLMLRHRLNERLLRTGGNIGYVVVPEYRRRGMAAEMLRLALPLARALGLERVLITCDEDNTASQRVVEKCGGVFEGMSAVPETGVVERRYWIALIAPASPAKVHGGAK